MTQAKEEVGGKKCPLPNWEENALPEECKYDRDGFCIFCGNKKEKIK